MLSSIINVAKNATQAVTKKIFLLRHQINGLSPEQKIDGELTEKIKVMILQEIKKQIHHTFPYHIVNEGNEPPLSEVKECWFIDFHGIENFIYDFPFYAVSIAFQKNRVTHFGMVYNPATDQTYVATKDSGVTLNNRRIRVKKYDFPLEKSLIAIHLDHSSLSCELYTKFQNQNIHIRQLGSNALSICQVAEGVLLGVVSNSLTENLLAANLIASEAGIINTTFTGKEFDLNSSNIVSCNPKVLKKILPLVN